MNLNELHEAIDNYEVVVTLALYDIAKLAKSTKDIFLRNTIAKSASLLSSIHQLHQNGKYHDGWILFRSLVERLATVYYLNESNSYDSFEQWTFIRNYEDQNVARSDQRFRDVLKDPAFTIDDQMTKKYNEYKKLKVKWKRPKTEDILKNKELDFIYKFGYDHASKHVHPMFDDGLQEFHELTKLTPNPYENHDFSILLHNSLIISTLIFQEAINSMSISFRALLYNYIESIRKVLEGDTTSYKRDFLKLAKLAEQKIAICEKTHNKD